MNGFNKFLLSIVEMVNDMVPRRKKLFTTPFSTESAPLTQLSATTPRNEVKTRVEGRQNALIDAGKLAYERNLTVPTTSEISLRTDKSVLINAVGSDIASLTDSMIIAIGLETVGRSAAAPAHIAWHQAIYQQTEHQAVFFCQPVYAMVVSQRNLSSFEGLPSDPVDFVAGIQLVDGTDVESVVGPLATNKALVIKGCGLLTVGETPVEAVQRAETVNYLFQIMYLNMQVGA